MIVKYSENGSHPYMAAFNLMERAILESLLEQGAKDFAIVFAQDKDEQTHAFSLLMSQMAAKLREMPHHEIPIQDDAVQASGTGNPPRLQAVPRGSRRSPAVRAKNWKE
jgi:hypothetical protein